jgi:hypothetical protein
MRSSSLAETFKQFQNGFPSVIGAWIAPGFCCIGEFNLSAGRPVSLKWEEQIGFSSLEQFKTSLQAIVKKRWLQGRPVVLSFSMPEIYSAPFDSNSEVPVEEQDLLPPGIKWDGVEYSIKKDAVDGVFACIRHGDIDSWIAVFKSIGLIAGQVIPAAIQWSRFFEIASSGVVSCSLQSGSLHYRYDGKWQGSVFVPGNTTGTPSEGSVAFSVALRPEFKWCPTGLIPALEGVFTSIDVPGFNLNPNVFEASRRLKAEKTVAKGIFFGSMGIAALSALLFLIIGGSSIWRLSVANDGQTLHSSSETISQIRQENKSIESRIASYKPLLSKKSSDARLLHEIGALASDSLWYSEIKISSDDAGAQVMVIGHSFSESTIGRLLVKAQAIPGIKKAGLEYTEKLSPERAGALTNQRVRSPLYRFKINFDFPSPSPGKKH